MEWCIDTSMTGEVAVSDLRKTLEASRDHWLETQAKAAGLAAAASHGAGPDPKADMGGAMAHSAKIAAAAAPLEAAHRVKSANLADAMKMGIDMACKVADSFGGGMVTARVQGHDDSRHASGSAKRMTINVDQTYSK